jgi:adenylosuccinate synthase
VRLNGPTTLAVHGLDYVDRADLGCRAFDALGSRSRAFVEELEERLAVPVRWLFTGPGGGDIIDRGPDLAITTRAPVGSRRSI